MNIERILEFAEKVPMEDLFNEIRKVTGLSDLKFTSKVVERKESACIKFQSQDLVDKVGFLKLIFSTIVISEFNSEIRWKSDLSIDDQDNYPSYSDFCKAYESNGHFIFWGTVDFSYTHPDGGSNGSQFLSFMYDERKGWEFN